MSEPVRLRQMFDLSGRRAIVTGSANILGPEFAAALAEFGAKVAMVDVDGAAVREKAAGIAADYRAEVVAFEADVTDEAAAARVVADVTGRWGGLDILVNGAACKTPGYFEPFDEYPLEAWSRVLDVILTGTFLFTKHALPWLEKSGHGAIVNISSQYGVVGPDPALYEGSWYLEQQINTPPVYSAAKAGVVGFTRYMATTLAARGIRANCITPGGAFSGQNDTFLARYAERCPLGRMARREELRGALVYLASDASSFVTGHNLVVDGGWTAR